MYKILIADDEILIRNSIAHLLKPFAEQLDEIIMAEDGLDALFKIKEFTPQIAIFDINMPFLNGLDAIAKLRSAANDVIIIIISGYDKFEYAQLAIKNKVFSYILKPIHEAEFQEVISSALGLLEKKAARLLPEQEKLEPAEHNIIKYITDHMGDSSLSMNTVCTDFHISNSSLSRLIKKETGMNFSDCLTKIRMGKAIALLCTQGALNIKEISEQVGYSNQHYFSRAFKNYTGVSPKKYKESL